MHYTIETCFGMQMDDYTLLQTLAVIMTPVVIEIITFISQWGIHRSIRQLSVLFCVTKICCLLPTEKITFQMHCKEIERRMTQKL